MSKDEFKIGTYAVPGSRGIMVRDSHMRGVSLPTAHLRWTKVPLWDGGEMKILQQMWIDEEGSQIWQDVPG